MQIAVLQKAFFVKNPFYYDENYKKAIDELGNL
jgi:hypothetical protein